jgi:hypothetical protein
VMIVGKVGTRAAVLTGLTLCLLGTSLEACIHYNIL